MAKPPLKVPLENYQPGDEETEEEFLSIYGDDVRRALSLKPHLGDKTLTAAAVVGNLALCQHAVESWGKNVTMGVINADLHQNCVPYLTRVTLSAMDAADL